LKHKIIDIERKLAFDMTPMIDCTFQLVIFFMLTLNYSMEEQDERIKLPSSEIAKPSETAFENSIMLQLTEQNTVLVGGDEVPIPGLRPVLLRERQAIEATKGRSVSGATVVLRADRAIHTGRVQDVIQVAQKTGFEKFVLRAREEFVSLTPRGG